MAKRGEATVFQPTVSSTVAPLTPQPERPGSVEWCHRWSPLIRYYKNGNAKRVRVSLQDGIWAEGDSVEEAAQHCHDRLQRQISNSGQAVLRAYR